MYRANEILNTIKQELSLASQKTEDTVLDIIGPIVFQKLREFYKAKSSTISPGDKVKNINTSCMHYGSEGIVQRIESLPENMGNVVVYQATNSGSTWKEGDILKKTEIQLSTVSESLIINDTMEDSNYLVSDMPINPDNIDSLHDVVEMMNVDEEDSEEAPSEELEEYRSDFLRMSLGSLKAIMRHAHNILIASEQPNIKSNLTESWLQGKIAITEDYMRTIHDFVMFVQSDVDDTQQIVRSKQGLWENIRKKKQREGKNYRPAKPGDKDRPDPEAYKRAQK